MEHSTYTEFNERKTVQSVLFISSQLKRKDFHKIFKILYFSDRDHLATYGRTITGDNYIAMADGPDPTNLYDIFKSVRGDGYFKDDGKFSRFFSVENWDLIQNNQEPDLRVLSPTDLKFLKENIEKYGKMSWEEIREKSHDYAWSNTALNRTISFENLITEAGEDESFIDFARQQSYLRQLVR
ncbi:MAG: SocA family protein [Sphingobacteriaceae bacterium]|nr:SocA family protein [Sphingobacteriaceae bacterium]